MAEKNFTIYDVPHIEHLGSDFWEVFVSKKALSSLESTYQVDGNYVPWVFFDDPNKSRNMMAAELPMYREILMSGPACP